METLIGMRGIDAGHRANVVHRCRLAFSVNHLRPREAENYARVAIQNSNALLQKLWGAEVVVRPPFEILSTGKLEHAVVIPRRTSVDIAAIVSDARVAGGIRPADRFGSVRGCVIGNDQFKIAECLR